MKKKILYLVLAILLAGSGYGLYEYYKPHASISETIPSFSLAATTLVSEYESDETSANQKYLGKVIEVTGIIGDKSKDDHGRISVVLAGSDLSGVGCEFETSTRNENIQIEPGKEIRIKGICTGILMDVVLVDCVVVTNNDNLHEASIY